MTLRLVEDDNGIVVTGTVKDNGTGRNLTACTVLLKIKVDGTAHTITATPDPDQTTNPGKFTAVLTSTHLATPGKGQAEVQVTEGSTITTYAADAADVIVVRADLT
jgi:hypothetical protein